MNNEALQLLKLTLNHELYERHKGLLLDEMFAKPVDRIWSVVKEAHDIYKRDLTEDEVVALVFAKNGVLTTAMKNNLGELLEEVKQLPIIGNDVALEVIKAAYKSEIGRAIIEESYSLIEGRDFNSSKIQEYLDQINNGYLPESVSDIEFVPTDAEELLAQFDEGPSWKFNIEGLQEDTGGLQPGTFTLIFARPEVGKSLTAISLACGPEGWASQGAKVLFIYNEELARRQMLRAMSCFTGLIADQIREDPKSVTKEFTIRNNLSMVNGVGWTTKDVVDYCKIYKPDIVVADQLDKFKDYPELEGHARLRQLYVDTREIGKICGCAIVAISQASVDAEGQIHLNYSMLEGSKTGKASECDLIIGVGANSIINTDGKEDNLRLLNLCKNKLSGKHTTIPVIIHPQISRMEDINKHQRK